MRGVAALGRITGAISWTSSRGSPSRRKVVGTFRGTNPVNCRGNFRGGDFRRGGFAGLVVGMARGERRPGCLNYSFICSFTCVFVVIKPRCSSGQSSLGFLSALLFAEDSRWKIRCDLSGEGGADNPELDTLVSVWPSVVSAFLPWGSLRSCSSASLCFLASFLVLLYLGVFRIRRGVACQCCQ